MKFEELKLDKPLLKAIEDAGFEEPTEIQEKTIPLALAGKDVIGESATGSGKTLAFGAGIIEKTSKGGGIRTLILTPTRELAEQVGRALRNFSRYKHLTVAMVYGGVAISPQIDNLKRAEIVVGTPGRILDHMERGSLRLDKINTLVLDEADKMLDMGFIDDVARIIEACPKERQTLLFSATISADINHIAKKYMIHPVRVESVAYVDASLLEQVYYDVPRPMKFSLLVHLLREEKGGLVMVFCNTRRNADFVARNLQNNGVDAFAIHGGLTQARRNFIMEKFRSSKVFVIVCTDVAARGLDVPNVSHIYNYDIPPTSKEYIHRIGRTARAGSEGKAISLVSDRDYDNFRHVMRDPSLKIKNEKLPEFESLMIRLFDRERPRQERGFGGPRYGGRSGFHRGGGRGGDRERGFAHRGRERQTFQRGERKDGAHYGRRERGGFSRGRRFGQHSRGGSPDSHSHRRH